MSGWEEMFWKNVSLKSTSVGPIWPISRGLDQSWSGKRVYEIACQKTQKRGWKWRLAWEIFLWKLYSFSATSIFTPARQSGSSKRLFPPYLRVISSPPLIFPEGYSILVLLFLELALHGFGKDFRSFGSRFSIFGDRRDLRLGSFKVCMH